MKLIKRNKLVCGVGINDADYIVIKKEKGKEVWCCPVYRAWSSMLNRCYSLKVKARQPQYEDATCVVEWLLFSKFCSWMLQQDYVNKQLDKDIIKPNNKHYSPETCGFVDQRTNKFLTDSGAKRGSYLIGVHLDRGKFRSDVCNSLENKREILGYFNTELEAHLAWKKRKHELALQLADLQTDVRVAEALRTRYL